MPSQSKQVSSFAGKAVSEQAMVHSAPSPSTELLELKVTISLLALELKFFGPLFWQNLGNIQLDGSGVGRKGADPNLWPPRERKSPFFLPLQ